MPGPPCMPFIDSFMLIPMFGLPMLLGFIAMLFGFIPMFGFPFILGGGIWGGGGGGGGGGMELRLKLLKLLGKTRTVGGMSCGAQLFWKTSGMLYTGMIGKMIYVWVKIRWVCLNR